MKIFYCLYEGTVSIVSAFNRGHAVKLLGKKFREEKIGPVEKAVVTEFDPDLNGNKGNMVFHERDS